jgi:hypothetical protein
MTGVRTPWWGLDMVVMQENLGRKWRQCRWCEVYIMMVKSPRKEDGSEGSWVALQIIGYDQNEDRRIIAMHDDLCNNPRIPGNRDPARSHRITVNEDQPAMPEEQLVFRERKIENVIEGA